MRLAKVPVTEFKSVQGSGKVARIFLDFFKTEPPARQRFLDGRKS